MEMYVVKMKSCVYETAVDHYANKFGEIKGTSKYFQLAAKHIKSRWHLKKKGKMMDFMCVCACSSVDSP